MGSTGAPVPQDPGFGKDLFELLRKRLELRKAIEGWLAGLSIPAPPPIAQQPLLPATRVETALRCAAERRQQLRSPLSDVPPSGFVRQEYLEIPPVHPDVDRRRYADELAEGCGQMARLEWQVRADEFLLLDRAVEAIVVLRRLAQVGRGGDGPRFTPHLC